MRQKQGLVEFAHAQTLRMQWHRQHQIDGRNFLSPHEHQVGQGRGEGRALAIFEHVNSTGQHPFVGIGGARAIKGGRRFSAVTTKVARTVGQGDRRPEGLSAAGADRAVKRPDRFPTGMTEKWQATISRGPETLRTVHRIDPLQEVVPKIGH